MNIAQIEENVKSLLAQAIEMAIQLLINGEIVHCRYDLDTVQVVEN